MRDPLIEIGISNTVPLAPIREQEESERLPVELCSAAAKAGWRLSSLRDGRIKGVGPDGERFWSCLAKCKQFFGLS